MTGTRTAALQDTIIQIRAASGEALGCGIFLSRTRILTCRHVLRDGDGRRVSRHDLRLHLPNAATGERVDAIWEPRGATDELHWDLAVLTATASFGRRARVLEWHGIELEAEDYPFGVTIVGMRKDGTLGVETRHSEIASWSSEEACFVLADDVAPGFSGGLVAHRRRGAALGMIVARHKAPAARGLMIGARRIERVLSRGPHTIEIRRQVALHRSPAHPATPEPVRARSGTRSMPVHLLRHWEQRAPALPKRSLKFEDPRAAEVLETTIALVEKLFDRAPFPKGARRRYEYFHCTYVVDERGDGEELKKFRLRNTGTAPIAMMLRSVAYDYEAGVSYYDLAITAKVTTPSGEVVVLPARNDTVLKKYVLFYLPPIGPGEVRDVETRVTLPRMFLRLVEGQADEFEVGASIDEALPVGSLTLKIARRLGPVRVVHEGGATLPDGPVKTSRAPGYTVFRWDFANVPPGRLDFKARLQLDRARTP